MSALLIVCAVSSCSKDDDAPANEGSTLVKYKTTFRDTLVFHYIYERDANNKIISARDSSKVGILSTIKLEYGNNGKVAKVLFLENGVNPISSFELEYNSDGRISKRKIRGGTLPVKEHYNVYVYDATGHLAIDSQFTTGNNVTFKLTMVSKFKYTGDNITEAENYTLLNGNGTLGLDTKLKYEYDNAINPFKGLENEYYINEAGSAIYTIPLKSANNVVKMYKADGNGGWDLLATTTYQYNSNNYAWKADTQNHMATQQNYSVEYFFQ